MCVPICLTGVLLVKPQIAQNLHATIHVYCCNVHYPYYRVTLGPYQQMDKENALYINYEVFSQPLRSMKLHHW